MKIEYTLTLKDYKSALALHARQTLGRRIKIIALRAVIPALAVCGLVAKFVFHTGAGTELGADLTVAVFVLLGLTIALPIARIFDTRICFNRLLRQVQGASAVHLDIGDEYVISAVPGVSEGKFFWNAIVDFAQNDKVILLYVAKKRFLFFPTSALSQAERIELTDLVARNLTRKQE